MQCLQPHSHPSKGYKSTSEGLCQNLLGAYPSAMPHRTQKTHCLPRGGIPLAPAHHTKGAISQLLEEMQVLLPNEAGEALQRPLPWAPRRGRGLPEGALRVMRGKLSLQSLSTEHLFEGSQGPDGTLRPWATHSVLPPGVRARLPERAYLC